MTTTNDSKRPPAGDAGTKPPPLWLFRALNPLMRALLRSPFHGLLSGMLMLLSYTGRKSGRTYTIPIGYFDWDAGELMAFTSAQLAEIAQLIDAGKVKPVILTVLPLAEAREAHALLEAGHTRGKIVLRVQDDVSS